MRRHTRWDAKLPTPGESPDWGNWRNNINQTSFPSTSHETHSPNTPAPLDYSSESRWRAQQQDNRQSKNSSKHSSISTNNAESYVDNKRWPTFPPDFGTLGTSSREGSMELTRINAWAGHPSTYWEQSSSSQVSESHHEKWWSDENIVSENFAVGSQFCKRIGKNFSTYQQAHTKFHGDRNTKAFRDSFTTGMSPFKSRYKFDRREGRNFGERYSNNPARESSVKQRRQLMPSNSHMDRFANKQKKKISRNDATKSPNAGDLNVDPHLEFKEPPKRTPAEEAYVKALDMAATRLKSKFLPNKDSAATIDDAHGIEDLSISKPSVKQRSQKIKKSRMTKSIIDDTLNLKLSDLSSDYSSADDVECVTVVKRRRHRSEQLPTRKIKATWLRRCLSEGNCHQNFSKPVDEIVMESSDKICDKVTKKIQSMDRQSLHQLVRDPTSVQSKKIVNLLLSMQQTNEALRLNKLRFKSAPSSTIGCNTNDALRDLPNHILQQVRAILSAEERNLDDVEWEEINYSSLGSIELKPRKISDQKVADVDVQIVTPPPKKPAATITISDSDVELHHAIDEDIPVYNNLSQNMYPPEPMYSCLPGPSIEKRPQFILPVSPIQRISTNKLQEPLSPLSKSPEVDLPTTVDSIAKCPASSPITRVDHPTDEFKVKQERSSPVSECGLCMHSPRSPHTPRCRYILEMPHSPVPLIPGPPAPLPVTAQRPVARMPTDLTPIFKHESYGPRQAPFMSLEHVDRPSSEERPKNPAPPDATNNEPPSPLPIPPIAQTLHGRPRPLVFPPDNDFNAPPRPAPPHPPLHTPRIKVEMHTPQYACCCMKSDCERASSRQSGEFSRPERRSVTPQLPERYANPFKIEQLYSRSRTPHQLSAFSVPQAPRNLVQPLPLSLESLERKIIVTNSSAQTDFQTSSDLEDKCTSTHDLNNHPDKSSVPGITSEYVKVMTQYNQVKKSESSINFGCEKDILDCLQHIDAQMSKFNEFRTTLMEALTYLHQKRVSHYKLIVDKAVNTDQSDVDAFTVPHNVPRESQSPENMSVVSSSQEVDCIKPVKESTSDFDKERCTSTSRPDDIDLTASEQTDSFAQDGICSMNYYHGRTYNASNEDTHDDIVVMEHRKLSGLQSPLSPKSRNCSGSEHGYSLRSRGPPSESNEYNSDSASKDHNDSVVICDEEVVVDDGPTDSPKRKRSRKSKYYASKRKRRFMAHLNRSSETSALPFNPVPKHKTKVLQIQVVGHFVLTSSSDCTGRLYNVSTGNVVATYKDHTMSVLSILFIGSPFSGDFEVITGCDDKIVRFFDGKTGRLLGRRNGLEPVNILASKWDYIFAGTLYGNGIKLSIKEKKFTDKVQYCSHEITFLLPHTEGGRKVLVVGAKMSPIMIRDAMSGLYLRALDTDSTLCTAIFDGNILYAAGENRNIVVYDFCSGNKKSSMFTPCGVSQLLRVGTYIVAVCHDGHVRIYNPLKREMIHSLISESAQITSSALYDKKVLLGNKYGEFLSLDLPSTIFDN